MYVSILHFLPYSHWLQVSASLPPAEKRLLATCTASLQGACQGFDIASIHKREIRRQVYRQQEVAWMVALAERINGSHIVRRYLGRGGFGECSIGSILLGGPIVTKRLRYGYDTERYNRVRVIFTLLKPRK